MSKLVTLAVTENAAGATICSRRFFPCFAYLEIFCPLKKLGVTLIPGLAFVMLPDLPLSHPVPFSSRECAA